MQTKHLLGIIVENKNIPFIKKMLNLQLINETIFYINNENIENLKNVKFDIILIFNSNKKIIEKKEILKKILTKAKCIILNSDNKENLELVQNLTLNVITFGFGSKATITASSIENEEILVCIQRTIKISENNVIEPQEIKVEAEKEKIEENAVTVMGVIGLAKIYDSL